MNAELLHAGRNSLHGFALGAAILLSSMTGWGADAYRDAVLADKPFAYYRLSEASNTEAVADEMGRNPGSFIHDPEVGVPGAISTDPRSTAVRLERPRNQYIKLTPLGNYGSKITSGFSVEYWLKTANSNDHQNILGAANSPHYITDFAIDIAYGNAPGRLRLYCRDNHENRFEINFYPGEQNARIYDQQWHHIVHVYDPKAGNANDQFRLYIDGERQAITATHKNRAPLFSTFNDPVTVGTMDLRGDFSHSLDGSLDEVAFYTGPLSGEQVAKHYQAAGDHEHDALHPPGKREEPRE